MTIQLVFFISIMLAYAGLGTGTGQEVAGCVPGYYLDSNDCKPCPDQCITYISDNNCTTCERNYYGQTCQLTCDDKCEGLCHKTYGHCTYECRDGYFAGPLDLWCHDCPTNCRVCNSSSNCFSCQPEFYGIICQNVCQNCTSSCHNDYGHCTHDCEDGSFHTDNATCLPCQQNCEVCRSENGCLRRKSVEARTGCEKDAEVESTVLKVVIPTATLMFVFFILAKGLVIYKRSKFTAREDSESQAAEVGDGKNSTGLLDETQLMKEHKNNI